jgi:hypothetical protein
MMEWIIEAFGNGIGNAVTWMADVGVLFAVFAVIWVAFGIALVRRHETVDEAWTRIRSLPLAVQLLVWLLFLPVMVGLWVWESTWPLVVRATLVLGIAGWNLVMFLPRALQTSVP